GPLPALVFADLTSMIGECSRTDEVRHASIDAACFGVAGPVIADAATLTNVPWRVDARRVATAFSLRRVNLLNDLQAMAYAVPVLREAEVHVLQEGGPLRGRNVA